MSESTVGGIIRILGVLTIVAGIAAGLFMSLEDHKFLYLIIYGVAGFIGGIMLMGYAEILDTLQLQHDRLYEVISAIKKLGEEKGK